MPSIISKAFRTNLFLIIRTCNKQGKKKRKDKSLLEDHDRNVQDTDRKPFINTYNSAFLQDLTRNI